MTTTDAISLALEITRQAGNASDLDILATELAKPELDGSSLGCLAYIVARRAQRNATRRGLTDTAQAWADRADALLASPLRP